MPLFLTKTKPQPTLADRETALHAHLSARGKLVSICDQKDAEAATMLDLDARYGSDGRLLLDTTDAEVEAHAPKLRAALREAARARAALEEFDRLHGGDEGAIRAEIANLQALMVEEERDHYRQRFLDRLKTINNLFGAMAEAQEEALGIYQEARSRYPDAAGCRRDLLLPSGLVTLSEPNNPASSFYKSWKLSCGFYGFGELLDVDDDLLPTLKWAREEGMVATIIHLPIATR